MQILKNGDSSLLGISHAYEDEINAKEKDVENLCLKIILQQQPVADDLRRVSAALKIVTDMERIGDNALDIANISERFHKGKSAYKPDSIFKMAVDDLFDAFMQELAQNYAQDQSDAMPLMELLLIGKYFEKISDHAVSIAEWTQFSVTGRR